MAVSKKRDKDVYKAPRNIGKPESENPKWLIPTALTLLITGVVWIVIYYITRGNWPLPISDWNLVVGFLGLGGGMAILTRWK
ncbi:cell division protein CrgA [Demequina sp. B12]|uniref:cell division protein CrgA n=1 Tax=Demequina sp. B12 TaxID=2992757 RepID=UPI00237BC0CD|nr:cell division protein CrgA [Demequina sp. B12]MDE0572102.1 cell division protein CrgA [Demequina sp. B12]